MQNNSKITIMSIISAIIAAVCLVIVFMWWKDLIYLKEEIHTLSFKADRAEQALNLQDAVREASVPDAPRVIGSIVSISENNITLESKRVTPVNNPKKGEPPFTESTTTIQVSIDKDTMFELKKDDFKKGDLVTILTKEEVVPGATTANAKLVMKFVPLPENGVSMPAVPLPPPPASLKK